MKRTTFERRLKKLTDSKLLSKNSTVYKLICNISTGDVLRPCYVSGRGRHIKNNDHTQSIKKYLDILKVKYIFGNDAPRGGLTGNFVKILSKID